MTAPYRQNAELTSSALCISHYSEIFTHGLIITKKILVFTHNNTSGPMFTAFQYSPRLEGLHYEPNIYKACKWTLRQVFN
jgi:hypothetical protein